MTKTLDLGCGAKPRNPFDADEIFGIDVREDLDSNIKKADLTIENIPYEDETFEYVTAFDFIEHVPRIVYAPARRNAFVEFMNEVYRVLKTGGYFLSLTPAYPNAVAFRDPTYVNIITDETFPLYFDDSNRWASIYGFKGSFRIVTHEWRGPHIFAILQKVPPPAPLVTKKDTQTKISVIIPIYNGEKYITETLDSLLEQSFEDFEIICVDDCSTDASLLILTEFSRKDTRVRVFQTPANMGSASKSLNYALQFARGDYFAYSSQDDIFSQDWLLKMHARAVATHADAVIPDLVFYYPNDPSRNRTLSGVHGNREIELSNRDAFLYSLDWTIPGNALWNMSLIKRCGFEEFGLNSDEFSVRFFFLNCNKVVFSEGVFFYRQDNENAVTKKITYKTFDLAYVQFRLYQLVSDSEFSEEIIHKEAVKVISQLNGLKKWLENNRSIMSEREIIEAESRLLRCVDCMRSDPMFEVVFEMGVL